jgi:hypothetical protein
MYILVRLTTILYDRHQTCHEYQQVRMLGARDIQYAWRNALDMHVLESSRPGDPCSVESVLIHVLINLTRQCGLSYPVSVFFSVMD